MRIGIDISQLAYEGTGVEKYLGGLLQQFKKADRKNKYVLFFSSMRKDLPEKYDSLSGGNVEIKKYKLPPFLLDFLWNKLHIFPIEYLIGNIDVFISSDWTEPPTKIAKKITILYDLIIYKYPQETDKKIIETQKRKLYWTKKESRAILCISEATKKDAEEVLSIEKNKLYVIYPGVTL